MLLDLKKHSKLQDRVGQLNLFSCVHPVQKQISVLMVGYCYRVHTWYSSR